MCWCVDGDVCVHTSIVQADVRLCRRCDAQDTNGPSQGLVDSRKDRPTLRMCWCFGGYVCVHTSIVLATKADVQEVMAQRIQDGPSQGLTDLRTDRG
jgi:hypothetical protein